MKCSGMKLEHKSNGTQKFTIGGKEVFFFFFFYIKPNLSNFIIKKIHNKYRNFVTILKNLFR